MKSTKISVNRSLGRSLDDYIHTQVHRFTANIAADEIEPLPAELAEWLGRLRLLYGVPFEYLVPEERLLPKESIRFFYLDRNWVDRLVDGALTIGKLGTRDYRHDIHRIDSVHHSLSFAEVNMRKGLRGEELDPTVEVAVGGTVTGLFIRSTLVADYPGLEVRSYDKPSTEPTKNKLTLLRMDRLSPDILFCLFHGVPKSMELEEPREGVQFGVEEGNLYRSRDETNGSYTDEEPKAVPMKASGLVGNRRVVDVKAFADTIKTDASSGDVAIQLLQFPYLQYFDEDGVCAGDNNAPGSSPFDNALSFGLFQARDILAKDDPRTIHEDLKDDLQRSFELVLGDQLDLEPIFK
ncbi:MAG: hypothetical protein GY799_10865 [Desulfobulbaceae bacterium]|nr:hypothetical protein [Desulfobulbaceae bacterium]